MCSSSKIVCSTPLLLWLCRPPRNQQSATATPVIHHTAPSRYHRAPGLVCKSRAESSVMSHTPAHGKLSSPLSPSESLAHSLPTRQAATHKPPLSRQLDSHLARLSRNDAMHHTMAIFQRHLPSRFCVLCTRNLQSRVVAYCLTCNCPICLGARLLNSQ